MKNRLILLLAALTIGGSFAFLAVRLAKVERENARRQERIAVMRESAAQARKAFDRVHDEYSRLQFHEGVERIIGSGIVQIEDTEAVKNLDAEIETLEAVSKEGK